MLEAGRPAAALAEVTRMPGRAAGSKWMEQARRHIEARRALDLIETAAILEPRRLRAIDGATVDEPSPQIGRAHVCTPVTKAHLVCRLLPENKTTHQIATHSQS